MCDPFEQDPSDIEDPENLTQEMSSTNTIYHNDYTSRNRQPKTIFLLEETLIR